MFSLLCHLAYTRGKIGETLLYMTPGLPVIETPMIREGLVLCPTVQFLNFKEGHAEFEYRLDKRRQDPGTRLSVIVAFFTLVLPG